MRWWRQLTGAAVAVSAVAWLWNGGAVAASNGSQAPRLEFLGEAIVPTDTIFEGAVFGGLSSITYDADLEVFHVLSDDQGNFSTPATPARFYTLRLDIGDGSLENGDVQIISATTLLAPDGQPYPAGSLDPEGLTLAKNGELIVTSEGLAARGIAPWARRYAVDGTYLGDLPVPAAFFPSVGVGVRQNLGFEAAAVAPDGRHLFVGAEGALFQDGLAATVNNGSPSRILRYNLSTGRLDRQYVYVNDPVAEVPTPPTAFTVNGLVELLPFNTQFMLSMERSFSVGAPGSGGTGNIIKLYSVAVPRADNVNGLYSIAGLKVRPVDKTLLLDLDELGIPLDNVEGMVLGPTLPDGRQSLILVSDNNFAPAQFTQFLMFAIW